MAFQEKNAVLFVSKYWQMHEFLVVFILFLLEKTMVQKVESPAPGVSTPRHDKVVEGLIAVTQQSSRW